MKQKHIFFLGNYINDLLLKIIEFKIVEGLMMEEDSKIGNYKIGDLKDPKKLNEVLKSDDIYVDLRFTDLLGWQWQHFTVPMREIRSGLESGIGFDGSSIKGFQGIENSDLLVMPQPETAFTDPFAKDTLVMIGDAYGLQTKKHYSKDSRGVAKRAAEHLKKIGIGDTAYFGPEAEFFIFDKVAFETKSHESFYRIYSSEGRWDGADPTHGYKPMRKEGYFPAPPVDSQQDIRDKMSRNLEKVGIQVERHHHEVGGAGQAEINIKYSPLLEMSDMMMAYKYIVKNTAVADGKTATFLPKVFPDDNGSGMHVHFSIWNGKNNLFAGNKYAGLSNEALWAIGGILEHAHAISAISNPTTISYKRLVPGFEAPSNLVYSKSNRSAAIRIPGFSDAAAAKRAEIRFPDPSCNPYLTFSAILMAAIDGIQRKIDPGKPIEKDIYHLTEEESKGIRTTPASLEDALAALEKDHEFLLEGGVFTRDLLDSYIKVKREEIKNVNSQITPQEFGTYFSV